MTIFLAHKCTYSHCGFFSELTLNPLLSFKVFVHVRNTMLELISGAVAKRLRHRDKKVPSMIPRSGVSVEVTSQCYFP